MYRFTNNLRTRIVNEKRGCQKREYTVRHHCTHCSKGVWARSRAISCDSCEPWIHTNCAGVLSDSLYDQLCSSGDDFTFECGQCSIHALSFPDGSTDDDTRDRSRISHSFVYVRYPYTTDVHTDQSSSDIPLDFECLKSKGLNFMDFWGMLSLSLSLP